MNASDARFTRLAAGTVRLERERKVLGSARRASGGAASMAVPHLALGRRRWRAVIVVAVMWSNTAAVSVADSRGNAYASPLARTT